MLITDLLSEWYFVHLFKRWIYHCMVFNSFMSGVLLVTSSERVKQLHFTKKICIYHLHRERTDSDSCSFKMYKHATEYILSILTGVCVCVCVLDLTQPSTHWTIKCVNGWWQLSDGQLMAPLIISRSLLVTLWVSPNLMTAHTHICAHTCAYKQQICQFIVLWLLSRVSNYEGRVRGRGRGQGRNGTGPCGQHAEKQTGDGLDEGGGCRGVDGERERWRGRGGWRVQRPPQIHGFDICVLLDSLLTARLSCPVPPLHSTIFSWILHLPPLVGCERGERKCGGRGAWERAADPFSLDAALCQARRDTFRDEGEVNVVRRMRELLKLSANVT